MAKVLIIYSTKYGTSKLVAEYIKLKLTDVIVCDILNINIHKIKEADIIILGASVYYNGMRGEMKRLLFKERKALSKPALALYVCSGVQEEESRNTQPRNVFGRRLCNRALISICAGYRIEFDKMDVRDKQFLQRVSRLTEDKEEIYTQEIDRLIETVEEYLRHSEN
jgi:menaquinone-dependent protoporphyrinogen IX oxidase